MTLENPTIEFLLGRIEGKLDTFMAEVNRMRDRTDKLEARIRGLERSRAWVVGGAAATGVILSKLLNYVAKGDLF